MTLGVSAREAGYAGGKPRYTHIKDLQAKAVAEARDLGAQTPVHSA